MMTDVIQSCEALLLALAIEQSNARWFHTCSARFLPYDASLSRLLEDLSREELSHYDELKDLYEATYGEIPEIETAPPKVLQRYHNGLQDIQRHFFVIDAPMARTILENALEIERYTRQFYMELKDRTADAECASVYARLGEYELEHEKVFLQRLEDLPGG